MRVITGSTRVAAVLGHPVRYSLSPALHNAAYEAMDVDAVYVAMPVESARVHTAVHAIRALDFLGASVTIPHKEAVIPYLDELAPEAARLRAVNCIRRDGDRLVGHNTDGEGFLASLREDLGMDPSGARCAVLGAGGAARAVIDALSTAGASDIAVVNRSESRTAEAVALSGVARAGNPVDISGADLIVNATPIGMDAGEYAGRSPLAVGLLQSGHVVVDLVYSPARTPLLVAAAERGARNANGLGMLIHQAAAQIALWTGRAAPVDVMRSAVLDEGH